MLSPTDSFRPSNEQLINFCMAEIMGLDAASRSPGFPTILKNIRSYPNFIRSREKLGHPMEQIIDISGGSRIVEIRDASPSVRDVFNTAHFAACSVLLDGYRFDLYGFQNASFVPAAKKILSDSFTTSIDQARIMTQRLVGIDATRTMQLLRLFGLVTRHTDNMYQIGLGAGDGDKDINYLHTYPAVRIKGKNRIAFGASHTKPADVIINDLDPKHTGTYETLSNNESISVTGYISDTIELLKNLGSRDIRKRNLVTALRIEPAMIPDAGELLHHLLPVLDEDCDFILSMGAGDTPDAYQRRLDVVNDAFNCLETANLEPVLFRLHMGGNVQQQGSSIQYGSIAASSYEILYCRMDREALSRHF